MNRATRPRRAVPGVVQIRLKTALASRDSVKHWACRYARAPECPWPEPIASWPCTAPTSAGGGKARECDSSGASAGSRGARSAGAGLLDGAPVGHARGGLSNRTRGGARPQPGGGAAGAPGAGGAVRAERRTRRVRHLQQCLDLLHTIDPARFGTVDPTLGAFGAEAVLVRLRTFETRPSPPAGRI